MRAGVAGARDDIFAVFPERTMPWRRAERRTPAESPSTNAL